MLRDLLEDLRFVIGLYFTAVSILVLGAGLVIDPPPEIGLNINLQAGGCMLAFGVLMLLLAIRAARRQTAPS